MKVLIFSIVTSIVFLVACGGTEKQTTEAVNLAEEFSVSAPSKAEIEASHEYCVENFSDSTASCNTCCTRAVDDYTNYVCNRIDDRAARSTCKAVDITLKVQVPCNVACAGI